MFNERDINTMHIRSLLLSQQLATKHKDIKKKPQ